LAEESSLTAILGVSGAGKSTLLRVVAGFEAADAGTVSVFGTVADDGRRRVPQSAVTSATCPRTARSSLT
jgi:iron(III) transport system ATP-binding protein